MRKQMNLNIVIYVNIVYLFIMQFVLQASSRSLDCTFDEDVCDWNQDDSVDFDWMRGKGLTQSLSTGPSSDHTWGVWWKGYYIYTEASKPRQNGDKARLISPMQEPGQYCLVFWYNMYGKDIGTLNVYMVPNKTVIFTKSGNIGDRKWRSAAKYYSAPSEYQIVIEGIRGQDTKGDIAVDDVSMTSGMCADCNFNTGLCQWIQDDADDFDWTWKKGPADTDYETGPPADHTSGNGHYIYIDSSETEMNFKAVIISPWQNSGKYCLFFWYYMYGDHVRFLRILQEEDEMKVEIIRIRGQQRQEWIQEHVFLNTTMRFRIIIEGRVRNRNSHDFGDIAVDDILMLSCQDCGDPTPRNGNANSSNFHYNSAVEITCNSGYYITAKPIIICKSAGTWSENPSCEPVESENKALVAVYVSVPIVVVALVTSLIIIMKRRGLTKCLASQYSNKKNFKTSQTQAGSSFSNRAYIGHNIESQTDKENRLPEDTDYAVITEEQDRKQHSESYVYYNTVDATITQRESDDHAYNHTDNVTAPFFDMSYSHVSKNKDENNVKSNYNTKILPCRTNESFQSDVQDENNKYDILDSNVTVQRTGTKLEENLDSEYDHAKAGGTDPEDLDDYSHLNGAVTVMKPIKNDLKEVSGTEYEYANEISEAEPNGTYPAQVGKVGNKPHFYDLEVDNRDSVVDDRHYFVLEKEDNDNAEQSGSFESNVHDYFVLEKMET